MVSRGKTPRATSDGMQNTVEMGRIMGVLSLGYQPSDPKEHARLTIQAGLSFSTTGELSRLKAVAAIRGLAAWPTGFAMCAGNPGEESAP